MKIPWIGFRQHMFYQSLALKEAGHEVEEYFYGGSGIEALKRQHYPLIIMQDCIENTVGAGIPDSITNPTERTCYLIKKIREVPGYEKTPIIVPHLLSEQEEKKYIRSGATECIDVFNSKSPTEDFMLVMKRHISQL